jgi:16S rRNA (guanine1207-N2)-methyltransferase
LARYLPDHFAGKGGDFGCGSGYLSRAVLARDVSELQELWCIDADARAVRVCGRNVEGRGGGVKMLWEDLTQIESFSGPNDLDFIVMNPPFHEGKATDSMIGSAFIQRAAANLRPGGALYMVANAHLPYEAALRQAFSKVEKIFEEAGFKGYRAVK